MKLLIVIIDKKKIKGGKNMTLRKNGTIKVLAVGAHPDDIELGAGGTIARHVEEGDIVQFIILTYGEQSARKEIRKREALESAKTLNVPSVNFAGIPDTMVTEGIETILKIERLVKSFQPDRVYTHGTKDTHQDHRNTALATFSATRAVPEVFSFESPDTFPSFNPQYYVRITDTLSRKIKALQKFHSQRNKKYLEAEAIKGLAQFRGYQVGRYHLKVEYAEAFEVIRTIEV